MVSEKEILISKVQAVFDRYRETMPSRSSATILEMVENDVIGVLAE